MKNTLKKRLLYLFLCFIVVLFVVNSFSMTQKKSEEELKKEYAPILGEYEFVTGAGTDIIRFYIEDGSLWADSGDGRPATLMPVEEEVFSFTAEDPINGMFEIKFLKDDQGEYTTCQIVNTAMGLDFEGIKIK